MKQKMTFFARALNIGATCPYNAENANQPKPAEAPCKKPRRVNGGAKRPGQQLFEFALVISC
jgi:hypothetical protein